MTIDFVIRDPSHILLTHQIVSILINCVIRDLSCILLTYRVMTMLIDFVIRDPSRILLTHRIMTMLIDSVIRDPSCILLTFRIVPMLINSVIRDPARDVTHPPDPSVWKTDRPGPLLLPLMIDYSKLHIGFACSLFICLYMEITCTPRPKTLLCNQIFHI